MTNAAGATICGVDRDFSVAQALSPSSNPT
jgi:hypothetical protein